MSRDQQIEEMAFNLIMATSPLGVKDLTKQFDYKTVATDLYELYGWRKSTDVAREIFEEIEDRLGIGHDILDAWDILAELKKKYTEEKKDV